MRADTGSLRAHSQREALWQSGRAAGRLEEIYIERYLRRWGSSREDVFGRRIRKEGGREEGGGGFIGRRRDYVPSVLIDRHCLGPHD